MRRLSALFATALLLLLPIRLPQRMSEVEAAIAPPEPVPSLEGTVPRNTSLARILGARLSASAIHGLVEAARPVYNLARISVGRPYALTLGPDGVVSLFSYGIDELRTLRVTRSGGALKAEVVTRRYETALARVAGFIRSSLFETLEELGESDELALDLADVFAWDVDFNTEIQNGDSFRVAVERLSLGGRFARYGRILAAEFVRGGRVLRAVYFDAARGPGYYMPDGRPLRKQFLRSPLRFTRITSRFTSARWHPLLNRVTTHFGIDYAAPAGAPVGAAADGVVGLAGWLEDFGQTVRLRHPNGYETLYGHLSRIDVRLGQRVTQGQTLGAVGATGLATGPHLDYRMSRNGAFVNPLTIQSPPAEPIPEDERVAFEAVRDARLRLLPGLPSPAAGLAAAQQPKALPRRSSPLRP